MRMTLRFMFLVAFVTAVAAATQPGHVRDVAQFRHANVVQVHTENTQRAPLWCWAACIQMCLRAEGIPATQEAIVQRNYGALVNRPAVSLEQIAMNLVIDYPTASGMIRVRPTVLRRGLTSAEVKSYIDQNKLIIMAVGEGNPFTLPQHVVVAYGYRQAPGSPLLMRIFDPWPRQATQLHEVAVDFTSAWEQTIVVNVERPRARQVDGPDGSCVRCGGSGWRPHDRCGGRGRLACGPCGGQGGIVCRTCDPRGLVRCPGCGGAGWQWCAFGPCRGCGFSGRVPCNARCMNGALRCPTCGGQKTARCNACGGAGHQPCRCNNGRVRCNH